MKNFRLAIIAFLLLAGVSSCVKDKFDAPPTGGQDPDLKANIRIDSLKAKYQGTAIPIFEDLIIVGVVTADDKSGNLYKTIVIQDSTGGIALKLDGTSLFNDYPIGRRLFIKLKGLYLGAYSNLIQIGGYIDATGELQDLPSNLFDKHIFKGVYGLTVLPKVVTFSQLNNSYQNTLIELNDVEFSTSDAGKPYADATNKISKNLTLKNCSNGSLTVRTSGYASFASAPTPTGKGKFVGIYSVFGTTGQLLVRDPSDLKMDSTRCGGSVNPNAPGILGVRGLYSGTDVTIPSGKTVTGTVISDKDNGNTDPKNLVIQDTTGGIVVRFTSNHSFALGDVVTVNLSGVTLSAFNGLVQATNAATSIATKVGTGTITPRVTTVSNLLANSNAWESTLVTIQSANITGGTTYSGTKSITDATGSINHFTRSTAAFSGATMPVGTFNFTGIVGNFNGAQLSIRNLTDVQ